MILLGAALSLWAAGNTHAAETRPPMQLAAYQAAPATLPMRLASFQSPDASQRGPYEPSTQSLLLVAVVLLSLRMRVRASSEKFST
ncbi:hypothetical protein CSQ90_08465 [Janthinobacterium sp. BJB303]|nr:hypothetical protein CSQ90_08465 [Janthinobacterium sp. BJB303]